MAARALTLRPLVRWTLIATFGCAFLGLVTNPGDLSSQDVVIVPFILYGLMGIRITSASPENPLGWTFLLVGALTGLAALGSLLIDLGTDGATVTAWYGALGAWIENWFWYPLLALSTIFTLLLFPTGVTGCWWRGIQRVLIGYTVAITVAGMMAPELALTDADDSPKVDNPLGAPFDTSGFTWVPWVMVALGLALGVASFVSLVVRHRHAGPVERLQVRWFMAAGGLLLGWVALSIVINAFWPTVPGWISDVGLAVVLSLIPLACGVAILRYHLYDLDRIVSRTTSYAIVTGLVLGTYVLVVTAATRLLPDASTLAVATATLAAAAVARPFLRRVQRVVDRRFDRTRYDAQRTVEAFGGRLRGAVETELVCVDLRSVVTNALQPLGVTVWLRER